MDNVIYSSVKLPLVTLYYDKISYCCALSLVKNVPTVVGRLFSLKLNTPDSIKAFWVAHIKDI